MTVKTARFALLALTLACGDDPAAGSDTSAVSTAGPVTTSSATTAESDTHDASTGVTSDGTSSSGSDSSVTTDADTTDPDTTDATTVEPTSDPTDPGTTEQPDWGCFPENLLEATLSGTVWAPNGVIPVSGALVYVTEVKPDPIPQKVYCAECLELSCAQYHTFTEADGTFTLKSPAADAKYLVVQKGQFMRVTELDIAAGETPLDAALTTLPDHNDPAADLYIPRIAIADGAFDRLEDAFGKFGLGDTTIDGFEERLVPGTEPFDLWENGEDPEYEGFVSKGSFAQLVANYPLMEQYHAIFVPCSDNSYNDIISDPQVQQNIHDWVEAGGRWYVADWSNDWIRDVFPQYQTFETDFGDPDLFSYDSLGNVLDDGLLAWLEALPDPLKDINPLNDEEHPTLFTLPQVETVDNWSALQSIAPVLVDDGMGGMVDVGHKIWIEGPHEGQNLQPLTVTGQYGCGKIQFTTYHAAEFFDYVGLSPQELVLFYTILEIGVCQVDLPVPQ
ncbi:MAG: carboxypeptidase regulatory-like domain-containing protein [Myxococcales bacterium]|nr:carboxypeptidase regulatory-like domain-containing protein [Myxococcales bacterium]